MATHAPHHTPTHEHDGFLRHKNFRWLKIASIISLVALIAYALTDVQPRHNGGSAYGYLLGTIGAGLVVWLTLLGMRKRAITAGDWSLKAWTSAHVYLGLSLIVIVTLHAGFQLGWNVHSLAYVLMMIVVASGIFGISAYANVPRAMSANRDKMTEGEMLASLHSLDRQLLEAAQPLSHRHADLVRASLAQDAFGGAWRRLTGRTPNCPTKWVQQTLRRETASRPDVGDDPYAKVDVLLTKKAAMLSRVRKHLRLKAMLEVWLYVHVPASFALIAALIAHIVSVFFYW